MLAGAISSRGQRPHTYFLPPAIQLRPAPAWVRKTMRMPHGGRINFTFNRVGSARLSPRCVWFKHATKHALALRHPHVTSLQAVAAALKAVPAACTAAAEPTVL